MPKSKKVSKKAKPTRTKAKKAVKKVVKKAKSSVIHIAKPQIIGPTTPLAAQLAVANGRKVGIVTHYFPKIGVAVVDVTDTIREGDEVTIRGGSTNFTQRIESMQIEHQTIQEARSGQSVGLKVSQNVRAGDELFVA